jgi:hypothetical protein
MPVSGDLPFADQFDREDRTPRSKSASFDVTGHGGSALHFAHAAPFVDSVPGFVGQISSISVWMHRPQRAFSSRNGVRGNRNFARHFNRMARSRCLRKNIPLAIFGKSAIMSASRLIAEGRTRRHERRVRDAVDVTASADGWWPSRTVKSYGPDTPTLVSRLRRRSRVAQTMVAKKPGAPGRVRSSRKTIARGMPDDRLNLW